MMRLRNVVLLALGMVMAIGLSAQKPKAYKLNVGDKFTMTVEMTQLIEQDMMGQSQTTDQKVLNVDEYEVVASGGGTLRLKSTGIRRKVTMSGAMEIEMDSDIDDEANLAMRALAGKSFYINMDKYGQVIALEGFDDYRKEISDDFVGTVLENQTEQILSALNTETIKTTFENFFHLYAPEKRKNWTSEYQLTVNNLPVSVVTNYIRTSAKSISGTGTLNLTGEIEMMGTTILAEMSGSQKTDYKLDKKTGLPKSVESNQDLSGEMNIQNITIPMTIKTMSKATITW